MNKILLSALLLFVSLISNSQVLPLDFSGYEKIYPEFGSGVRYVLYHDFYKSSDLISTGSIVTESRDSDEVISLFPKAEKNFNKKNYSAAKEKLELFISLRLSARDTGKSFTPIHETDKLGNKACSYLKQIYFMESNYIKALYYHNLEVNVFPERFVGCAWGVEERHYALNLFASKCYEGMMDYNNAIDVILKHWFFNNNVDERFADLLIKKMGRETLQEEINKIIADSLIELNSDKFTVTLGGYSVPVYPHVYNFVKIGPSINEITEAKNKALKDFTNSIIYKLIMEN